MARETAAQRNARVEAERAARDAVTKATYPERLMAVLERATKVNYELTVKNLEFRVEDRDQRRADVYLLKPTYTPESNSTLQSLDWSVETKEEEQAEAQRRSTMKQAALAKLTPEERELLNL